MSEFSAAGWRLVVASALALACGFRIAHPGGVGGCSIMKRAGIALVVGVLLVACNDSGTSENSKRKSGDTATETTGDGAPQYLEWATPDGYRYAFKVTDRRVEEVASAGFVTALAEVEMTNLLDRRDNRVNFPHATDRRLVLGIRQERFGGVCPADVNETYDYQIYVAAAGYCVITSSAIAMSYELPKGPNESLTIPLSWEVSAALGVEAADIGVLFFDPLLTLTPVLEILPAGATYGVNRSAECENPVSGELRPECEAAFHPDLLVPVP